MKFSFQQQRKYWYKQLKVGGAKLKSFQVTKLPKMQDKLHNVRYNLTGKA
jgi:hypothetical protein